LLNLETTIRLKVLAATIYGMESGVLDVEVEAEFGASASRLPRFRAGFRFRGVSRGVRERSLAIDRALGRMAARCRNEFPTQDSDLVDQFAHDLARIDLSPPKPSAP
jgi:hypothetical protein